MFRESNHIFYHEKKDRKDLIKRLLIGLLVVILIIILFLLFQSCDKAEGSFDKEKTLLEAGKEYYGEKSYQLPQAVAECGKVTLKTLVAQKYLKAKQYDDCDNNLTYVKVCKLASGTIHYAPILVCDSIVSDELYGDWKEGTEDDVIVDESDIKFSFIFKYLETSMATYGPIQEMWLSDLNYSAYQTLKITKYYRYKDIQYLWNINGKAYYPNNMKLASDVREYYITTPATGYTNKDSANENVYKWYTVSGTGKTYYMVNGSHGYALTAPVGYPYAEGGITYASRSRTWTQVSLPITTAPTHYYQCDDPNTSENLYYNSFNPCDEQTNNPTFTEEVKEFYTCDGGITEVTSSSSCYACTSGALRTDKTSCGAYGSWVYSSSNCTGQIDVCQNLTTPITLYEWYKYTTETRSYYPSGSSTAAGEKTYYAKSPNYDSLPGTLYHRDEATRTTGYKWYKTVSTQTTKYYTTAPEAGATRTNISRATIWSSWSTTMPKNLASAGTRYIEAKDKIRFRQIFNTKTSDWKTMNTEYSEDLNTLITQLNMMGYEIDSLADIASNGELKYLFKMYVRNKE